MVGRFSGEKRIATAFGRQRDQASAAAADHGDSRHLAQAIMRATRTRRGDMGLKLFEDRIDALWHREVALKAGT